MAELLATVGLFAMLAGVAAPHFMQYVHAGRLNGAARQVLAELMWARTKAVEENNQFVVSFPTNNTITVLDDDDNDGAAGGGEWTQTKDIQTNYSNVTHVVVAGSTDPVVFSPRGTSGGTTTIRVSNSSGSKDVTVSLTGYVRIN